MKVWKNILLLTALPITTFVVPQVLSSCANVAKQEEKVITYTKFDKTNIDSITTLDNNMYDVGLTFGKDIITISGEENTEIQEKKVKFKHWGDVFDPTKLTIEFIIDLTKMKNLEVIHANLKYFMSGAYQSYCLNNQSNIENLPENPYFKIIFPPSLKKFVYLDGAHTNDLWGFDSSIVSKYNDIWVSQLKQKKVEFNYLKNILFNKLNTNKSIKYFVDKIRWRYDFSNSINLESFQMHDINNQNESEGLYGDLIVQSSVQELIPPIIWIESNVIVQKEYYWFEKKTPKYNLKFNFKYNENIINRLNERKNTFVEYFESQDYYKRDLSFVKDFSLFPIRPDDVDYYYENIYIDSSFKSINGLKFLFGGTVSSEDYKIYNLSDSIHDTWFQKMIDENKIYKYYYDANIIDTYFTLSNIIWI